MAQRRGSLPFASKYVATYTKLFQGSTPEQIAPREDAETFWTNLLVLDVDVEFLSSCVRKASTGDCLGYLKPLLNALFSACLLHARRASYGDSRKLHALMTLSVVSGWVLKKNLAGWEVMEVVAGGMAQSDGVFMELVSLIDDVLGDKNAPREIRHQALQLALVFVCGVNQLSPGAYFLRRDLFPAIVTVIRFPETKQFAFEAAVLLALLANFHKSDAAYLNPYLKRMHESEDKELMRTICWAANYAAETAVRAYQGLLDDFPPVMAMSRVGSLLTIFRPDHVLSDPPRHLFKHQPIEAALVLLPTFEFLHGNPTFLVVFTEPLSADVGKGANSLPFTLITLASYILTHATSSSSPRAVAYANLSLNILSVFVESSSIMDLFCQPCTQEVRLCRQRIPHLPFVSGPRPPMCAVLDCCVLWLRHNLHKRLDVYSYSICIRICHRIIWFLQQNRVRLEYHWVEFWRAILGVLDFISKQLANMYTTGGVESLLQKIISLLCLSFRKAEVFLPTPKALHEFIYELVRCSTVIDALHSVLESLTIPDRSSGRSAFSGHRFTKSLSNLTSVVNHYKDTIGTVKTAKEAIRRVAREVDKDGLFGAGEVSDVDDHRFDETQAEDVIGILRFAYTDGMSLML